jgi:hypothetical protein
MFSKNKDNVTVWVPKDHYASYKAGPQPDVDSTPKDEGSTAADVEAHGPVHKTTTVSDHQHNKHTVKAEHVDGFVKETTHGTGVEARKAAEECEQGGPQDWTDRKRKNHPDQQGAESSEKNYVNSDPA